ncbi:MAG: hypothetical protein GY867_05555 [bacterium]|nr:hypothetical protein [bacterium]
MSVSTLTLKIDTPTGTLHPGRGFYQQDEEALYVQVGEVSRERRCFSYLEADTVRFDLDQHGLLMGILVAQARRRWQVEKRLALPRIAEPADVRWLDFREQMPQPQLITNRAGNRLLLRFASSESWRWYLLAENIHVQVDPDGRLAALLISDIVDDFAGKGISRYRKKLGGQLEDDPGSHPT